MLYVGSANILFVVKRKSMEIAREEELKQIQEFIEKNGVTKLPPDERLKMHVSDVWKKTDVKKGKRGRRVKK